SQRQDRGRKSTARKVVRGGGSRIAPPSAISIEAVRQSLRYSISLLAQIGTLLWAARGLVESYIDLADFGYHGLLCPDSDGCADMSNLPLSATTRHSVVDKSTKSLIRVESKLADNEHASNSWRATTGAARSLTLSDRHRTSSTLHDVYTRRIATG